MPETTVFLLAIMDSSSLYGPVTVLHQDNGISNQINRLRIGGLQGASTKPRQTWPREYRRSAQLSGFQARRILDAHITAGCTFSIASHFYHFGSGNVLRGATLEKLHYSAEPPHVAGGIME
jgi:hypothetical protein